MAPNTFKCNYLTPLHFKGLTNALTSVAIDRSMNSGQLRLTYYSQKHQSRTSCQALAILRRRTRRSDSDKWFRQRTAIAAPPSSHPPSNTHLLSGEPARIMHAVHTIVLDCMHRPMTSGDIVLHIRQHR